MTNTIKTLALAGASLLILGTTPPQAQANIDLKLGGYYAAYGVFADQSEDAGEPARNTHNFELMNEAEVHFIGEKIFDNGLIVGTKIELEAQTNGDQIDESHIYFAGDWGRINIGSEHGAGSLLQVGAPSVDSKFDGIDPSYVPVNLGGNDAVSNNSKRFIYAIGASGDSQRDRSDKFTYLSPIMEGFQFGVSYTATGQEDGSVRDGFTSSRTSGGYQDEVQLAGKWQGQVDDVLVTAGAGYLLSQKEARIPTTDDREQWNVGLNLGFKGVTVGGAYFRDDTGFSLDDRIEAVALGANYKTGPYKVGVSYLNKTNEEANNTEDEATRYLVGGSYQYGPGMVFNASVHFYELEDNLNAVGDENDATILTIGTIVSF